MSARYQQLENTARRWMNELWTKHDFSNFDALHHPNFQDMSPAGRDSDREAYRLGIQDLFTIFPDFAAIIEDLVVDESKGKVAIRWSAQATHLGDFMGLPATGRALFFQGLEIIAIDAAGLIVERWGEWDGISLLQQITAEGNNQDVRSQ